jgi:ubiquitin C-terminal hydrolase
MCRKSWNPTFVGRKQQDVHEAFVSLLDACDEIDVRAVRCAVGADHDPTFNTTVLRHTTPYQKLFGNLAVVKVTCARCDFAPAKYERAHAHALPILDDPTADVITHLTNHLGREPLGIDYQCDGCGHRGTCSKNTQVVRWPPVLVLSFKRWEYDARLKIVKKISRHIKFETILPIPGDRGEFVVFYNLIAVIVHDGVAGGGHYIAYVRGCDNHWYKCDDESVPRHVSWIINTPCGKLVSAAIMY